MSINCAKKSLFSKPIYDVMPTVSCCDMEGDIGFILKHINLQNSLIVEIVSSGVRWSKHQIYCVTLSKWLTFSKPKLLICKMGLKLVPVPMQWDRAQKHPEQWPATPQTRQWWFLSLFQGRNSVVWIFGPNVSFLGKTLDLLFWLRPKNGNDAMWRGFTPKY